MFERRSLKWPITLGVVMIVLVLALIVGWIINAALSGNWTMLAVGTTLLVLVLVGVVMYLSLSIKEINLNRRQSNFMDSVTHELKSPIASLKLYLQTLNRRTVSSDEQHDFFRFMLDDVDRLDHLINHLLDAARLEKSTDGADVESIDLDKLLQECTEELRLRYRVPLEQVDSQLEPIVVHTRRVDLDIVVRNLIDNAFKYAGDPPHVQVSAQMNDAGSVVIQVGDNGRGVPLRFRHKIFGRFVRLGDELKRHKPGTGLGLYIAQTLVRRMRGRIRVRDRDGGSGTIFEVQLPSAERRFAANEALVASS